MRRRRFMVATLLGVFSVFAIVTAINACECGGPPPAKEAAIKAEYVFVGKVIQYRDQLTLWRRIVDKLFPPDPEKFDVGNYERDCGFAVTFEIQQSFKGDCSSHVTLFTGRGTGDCGYHFQKGQTYLVYAYKRCKGVISTDICTRTRLASAAKEEIAELSNPNR